MQDFHQICKKIFLKGAFCARLQHKLREEIWDLCELYLSMPHCVSICVRCTCAVMNNLMQHAFLEDAYSVHWRNPSEKIFTKGKHLVICASARRCWVVCPGMQGPKQEKLKRVPAGTLKLPLIFGTPLYTPHTDDQNHWCKEENIKTTKRTDKQPRENQTKLKILESECF